jgi:predicted aspartyl protease
MIDEMGTFRTGVALEHPGRRGVLVEIADVMVDTGSEFTWLPRSALEQLGLIPERTTRFRTADGRVVEREVCFAIVHAAGTSAAENVVFADPTDMVLLGARTIEGLNLRIDLVKKELVDAGPVPVAPVALAA